MTVNYPNITKCNECGSQDISWQTSNTICTEVQPGRLRTSDVQCKFVLGCDNCSETLALVNADEIASDMNNQLKYQGETR